MYYTKITIFHIIFLLGLCFGLMTGMILGYSQYGIIGAIIVGVIGLYCGGQIGFFPHRLANRAIFKHIEKSTNEELRRIIDRNEWNFYNTLALMELSKRNQNINTDLYRIFQLLQSDNFLQRLYAWDALRLVFPGVANQLTSYDPKESFDICQLKLASFSFLAENK
ncbi:MAG: hypothetical protein WAQ98_18205 [Blastocatellia bacterium]